MDHIEQILEGISGGFFALDPQLRFTYWNRAAEDGTGLKREDVLGKNVFEVFPNAESAELGEKYRLAMQTKTFQSIETSYRDDRFEAWYDVRIYPTETGLSVLFQDITEKKRQERQKEALLQVSHAINSAQHLDDLCIEAADKIAHFMGVPSKFVCIYHFDPRRKLLHLLAPMLTEIPNASEDVLYKIVHEAEASVAVRTVLSKQPIVTDELVRGSIAPYLLNEIEEHRLKTLIALPLLVQNDVQGVLEVLSTKDDAYAGGELGLLAVIANELAIGMSRKELLREITVKNVELEQEKLKTEEANETLKKFLATFSHELRAPLNSIVGFSEFLAEDFQTLPPAQIQEFMKNVQVSGKHLQQLINDILDLSKIEAGKLELHVESYPVSYFSDTVRRVLQSAIESKKIDLCFEVASDIDQLVVDQTRLKQILVNLVSNAVKYSDVGGRVTVGVRRVDNEIEVDVTDQGTGIKPEDLPRLFRPFQQARRGGILKEGTGLGLAITKRLVELHGGHIWAESEWGKGSTFRFRIPMVLPGEVTGLPHELLSAISGHVGKEDRKHRILIVEDNQQAAQLIEKCLQDAGYETEIARDGVEGIEKAKQLKPDVITLDLILPLKDGWQVMKELKRHPICKDIPVIIISITDEKKLGFSLGAAAYFVKPINRGELVETVKRVPLRRAGDKEHPRVLIIDDDKTAADLMEVMLEAEGYDVHKCYNGRDGLKLAQSEEPDLIILDLIMPEVSGFNVAYQLKRHSKTRSIPIIILTSMDIDEHTKEQLQGFVSGLMTKSRFTKRDLLREINSIEKSR